jgi:predicted glycoside hydrolase/deacetylase ChbG (UPF0249 family)
MERVLIVNADDFGQSAAITRGILRAQEDGIVTSASLMVRWPGASYAADQAEGLDLGLHIDLGEWAYRDGCWTVVYERVNMDQSAEIEREIESQLAEFSRLTGKTPSHLDSHQHVHLQEPVRSIATSFAAELGVPLRGVSPDIRYCGNFYGQSGKGDPCPQAVCVDALVRLIEELPPGITELGCHPGEEIDGRERLVYAEERKLELDTLCDLKVREAIVQQRVRLCSFADVASTAIVSV